MSKANPTELPSAPEEEKLREALAAIQKLDFGEVNVTVHQSKVVEVKITRRKRYSA
jgi:hypothetical protein